MSFDEEYLDDHYLCQGAVEEERAEFKNFHRLLCERFGYAHDEMIEHIANSTPQKGHCACGFTGGDVAHLCHMTAENQSMGEWTEWQPIATAPEDRPVLVVGTLNNMLEPFPEMFVAEYRRGWWAASHVLSHVTHWRELPGFPSCGLHEIIGVPEDPNMSRFDAVVEVETSRAKALRGEVVTVTDSRLKEMQAQAIQFEGIGAELYHWHWAAVVNELLWLRAHSSLNFADAVPRRGES